MGVSGQRHAPGKEPPVLTVQEAGWVSEPVWTQKLEEKSCACAGNRTSITQSSSPWSYTILTELPRLLISIYGNIIYTRRSRWPRGLRRRSAAAWLLGSRVRIPMRTWMFVSCLYVVLSCVARVFCDGLITRPEESYRVSICLRWGIRYTEEDKAHRGL
jgi:hypothetical protein